MKEPKQTEFGKMLRQTREANSLSMKELGAKMGWSGGYIADIETGRRPPPALDKVLLLGNILHGNHVYLAKLAMQDNGKLIIPLKDKDDFLVAELFLSMWIGQGNESIKEVLMSGIVYCERCLAATRVQNDRCDNCEQPRKLDVELLKSYKKKDG